MLLQSECNFPENGQVIRVGGYVGQVLAPQLHHQGLLQGGVVAQSQVFLAAHFAISEICLRFVPAIQTFLSENHNCDPNSKIQFSSFALIF